MAMISPARPPALSIKAVVLTRITINEVEKLRKWPSLWSWLGCFLSTSFLNGARIFSLPVFFSFLPSTVRTGLNWTREIIPKLRVSRDSPTHVCAFYAGATPAKD